MVTERRTGVPMADQQAAPSGPDLTQGVASSDFVEGLLAALDTAEGKSPATQNVRFSNWPFGVKRFQAIRRCGVDVARGLVLLFGIGTRALPS
jgi:hypothetical protein